MAGGIVGEVSHFTAVLSTAFMASADMVDYIDTFYGPAAQLIVLLCGEAGLRCGEIMARRMARR